MTMLMKAIHQCFNYLGMCFFLRVNDNEVFWQLSFLIIKAAKKTVNEAKGVLKFVNYGISAINLKC